MALATVYLKFIILERGWLKICRKHGGGLYDGRSSTSEYGKEMHLFCSQLSIVNEHGVILDTLRNYCLNYVTKNCFVFCESSY